MRLLVITTKAFTTSWTHHHQRLSSRSLGTAEIFIHDTPYHPCSRGSVTNPCQQENLCLSRAPTSTFQSLTGQALSSLSCWSGSRQLTSFTCQKSCCKKYVDSLGSMQRNVTDPHSSAQHRTQYLIDI